MPGVDFMARHQLRDTLIGAYYRESKLYHTELPMDGHDEAPRARLCVEDGKCHACWRDVKPKCEKILLFEERPVYCR